MELLADEDADAFQSNAQEKRRNCGGKLPKRDPTARAPDGSVQNMAGITPHEWVLYGDLAVSLKQTDGIDGASLRKPNTSKGTSDHQLQYEANAQFADSVAKWAASGKAVSTLFSRLLQGFDQCAIRSAGSDSERLYLPIAMEMAHKCIEKVAVEEPPTQAMRERAALVTRFDTKEIFAAVGKEGFGAPPEVQTVGMISMDTYDETTSIEDSEEYYPTMAVILFRLIYLYRMHELADKLWRTQVRKTPSWPRSWANFSLL